METKFRLEMDSPSGSGWYANADTLLQAHEQMQRMIKYWTEPGACGVASFRMIESCAGCMGAGVRSTKRRNPKTYRFEKPCVDCKGANPVILIDYKPLDTILATSQQFIDLETRRALYA